MISQRVSAPEFCRLEHQQVALCLPLHVLTCVFDTRNAVSRGLVSGNLVKNESGMSLQSIANNDDTYREDMSMKGVLVPLWYH